MLLTKFTHSCVRIADEDRALVIDPGAFSEVEVALDGVDAVLITHEHADHVDQQRLAAVAADNPNLQVWAPLAVTEQLASSASLQGRLTAVEPGQEFTAGGFPVRTFGGQHALIHSSIPTISNVCFLIEGAIYHPGDSFVVPPASVELALIPLNAPWAKLAETIDFAIAVRAARAVGIHEGLLGELGLGFYGGQLQRIAGEYGIDYTAVGTGESIEL